MRLRRDRQGDLWLENIPLYCADTYTRIPEWLASDDPDVRARLRPRAARDPDVNAEWQRYAAPELDRLFLSREGLIRRDLATLARSRRAGLRFRIAHGHESAWLSALNGARHALFILHAIDPAEVEGEVAAVEDPIKRVVLARLVMLGWLQELLIAETLGS